MQLTGINTTLLFIELSDRREYSSSIRVTYKTADGQSIETHAQEGQDIMRLAHENDIELEGACEGSLACSTCHVIVDPSYYSKIPEPSDEENDMLDLAFGLTETYCPRSKCPLHS